MTSIYPQIISLLYIVLIFITFFAKKKKITIENNIFSLMIIGNFIGLLLDVLSYFVVVYTDYHLLSNILCRAILIYLILWIFTMTVYIYAISHNLSYQDCHENNDGWLKYLKFKKIIIFLEIIFSILCLFLPVKIVSEVGKVYSIGLANIVVYILSAFLIFFWIAIMIMNNSNIREKKFYPIYVYIFLGIFVSILQFRFPQIILIIPVEAFITILMYHTIENPDIKMIEELEVARNQAEKANRAKTDFLSSMSHEIRTPLNAIVGFSDCILEAKDLDEAKENAHDIVNASHTLLEIVNGILDISKIEAGKIEIINSPYSAPDIFLELAKLITPKMNEKSLDFSYNIASDLPETLYGDSANLRKVVTNLLSNACKYTDRGFVHYEVNCVNTNNVCKLIISVEDSGRGIKNENIDKLFTKFQRLDEDKNTTIEGTGLGLAITKQLVELMGGRIIVHTVYGEGSKFTVILNQKIEKTEVKKIEKPQASLNLKDMRILVVDDNELNLKLANKLLGRYNANMIDTCYSGFTCLEKIKHGEKYDLILLDDMMPKMRGVETLKKLKEIPGFNIPTVALTANAISGMRERYLEDGFDDYLAKPIEKDQLIQVINGILEKKKLVKKENEEEVKDVLESRNDSSYKSDNIIEKFDREYLENNGVDMKRALELLGDMEMYNMTIRDFVYEADDKWEKIVNFKVREKMDDYSIEIHSLKSDSEYLGFMTLADIAYEHEKKSKEKNIAFINKDFERLEEEYKKILAVARKYVDSNQVKE